MSRAPRPKPRDEPAQDAPVGIPAGRQVARSRRPPAAGRIPPRQPADDGLASAGAIAALRARLLQFALTLPDVALDDSRLDPGAAGLFVRVSRDDETGFEMREFATLRTHPQWRLSVVLPIGATADLQRLGWGRPRDFGGARPLLFELVRPHSDAHIRPLQRALEFAYRAAAGDQGRNR